MKNKVISVALVGKTNAGKSTFLNNFIGEKISIENKKINTTLEAISGVLNIKNTQIIIFDTPGFNLLNKKKIENKKQNIQIWNTINKVDIIFFVIDSNNLNYTSILKDIKKVSESNKLIIIIFNKIDLIIKNEILPVIQKFKITKLINDFFIISAKYTDGMDQIKKYLIKLSKPGEWIYNNNEITNKSDIYICNECTRNAILKFLHKEIPYKIKVSNQMFKYINKKNLKIKQLIEINNLRYKSIILGKKGEIIKKIRETSQKEIENIFNLKIHLYLKVVNTNAK